MSEKKELKEELELREREKEKLFRLMFANESKEKVKEQFKKFEKAHNKALEAYKNAS